MGLGTYTFKTGIVPNTTYYAVLTPTGALSYSTSSFKTSSTTSSGATTTTTYLTGPGVYYYIDTFTANGSYVLSSTNYSDVLLVAGGGGGGATADRSAGGGGAGGLLYYQGKPLTAATYTVNIGGAGSGGTGSAGNITTVAGNGGNTSFTGLTTVIGGGGGGDTSHLASTGGSGGGQCHNYNGTAGAAGTSGQGYAGGAGYYSFNGYSGGFPGSGGGGSGGVGLSGTATYGGTGGPGTLLSITGLPLYYAAGGGGGFEDLGTGSNQETGGSGGSSGAGYGLYTNAPNGSAGSFSGGSATFYGCGGGSACANSGGSVITANSGGSGYQGIVIVRYTGGTALPVSPIQYPPLALTNDGTNAISGQTVGNGNYVVSASSEYGSSLYAWYGFDRNPSTLWAGAGNYSSTTGAYTSLTYYTTVNGTNLYGEWLQIQMPYPIILSNYSIQGRADGAFDFQTPYVWVILGSNDGSTWTQVDSQIQAYAFSAGTIHSFYPCNTFLYSYYRLSIQFIQPSAGNPNVSLGEWALFGTTCRPTTLLLHCIGSYYDSGPNSYIGTVSGATLSTSAYVFGGSSIYFNGTSYISYTNSQINFPAGTDFTIEFWLYAPSSLNGMRLIGQAATAQGWQIYGLSSTQIQVYLNSTGGILTGTYPTATWFNIAFCRTGTTYYLYINGIQQGSTYTTTNALNSVSDSFYIGWTGYTSDTKLTGYINDLRVTSGYNYYTINYSPSLVPFDSSTSFPTQGLTNHYNANIGVSGSTVSTWNDLSGNGNTLSLQGSGVSTTTLINGVYFPYANTTRYLRANCGITGTTITICFVMSLVYSGSGGFQQFFASDGNYNSGSIHLQTIPNTRQFQLNVNASGGNSQLAPNYSFTDNQIFSLIFDYNATTGYAQCQINGLGITVYNNMGTCASINCGTIDIGCWSGDTNRVLNGTVYEVMIYNRLLTSTERTNINNYFNSTWGIGLTLSSLPPTITSFSFDNTGSNFTLSTGFTSGTFINNYDTYGIRVTGPGDLWGSRGPNGGACLYTLAPSSGNYTVTVDVQVPSGSLCIAGLSLYSGNGSLFPFSLGWNSWGSFAEDYQTMNNGNLYGTGNPSSGNSNISLTGSIQNTTVPSIYNSNWISLKLTYFGLVATCSGLQYGDSSYTSLGTFTFSSRPAYIALLVKSTGSGIYDVSWRKFVVTP